MRPDRGGQTFPKAKKAEVKVTDPCTSFRHDPVNITFFLEKSIDCSKKKTMPDQTSRELRAVGTKLFCGKRDEELLQPAAETLGRHVPPSRQVNLLVCPCPQLSSEAGGEKVEFTHFCTVTKGIFRVALRLTILNEMV
jgi:hypothetical protein